MPHVELKPCYSVSLTHDEFRLVTMALARMLKDPDDITRAAHLNEHLCHLRAVMLRDTLGVAERALEGAHAIADAVEDHQEKE